MEGGAKALAKEKGALTTNRADVLSMDDPQIVDVRDDKTYEEGHLKDTLQVDLKDIESPDDLFIIQDGAKDSDISAAFVK